MAVMRIWPSSLFGIESHGLHFRKHLAQVCDLFWFERQFQRKQKLLLRFGLLRWICRIPNTVGVHGPGPFHHAYPLGFDLKQKTLVPGQYPALLVQSLIANRLKCLLISPMGFSRPFPRCWPFPLLQHRLFSGSNGLKWGST